MEDLSSAVLVLVAKGCQRTIPKPREVKRMIEMENQWANRTESVAVKFRVLLPSCELQEQLATKIEM